jgi:hypothetical protein
MQRRILSTNIVRACVLSALALGNVCMCWRGSLSELACARGCMCATADGPAVHMGWSTAVALYTRALQAEEPEGAGGGGGHLPRQARQQYLSCRAECRLRLEHFAAALRDSGLSL